MPGENAKTDANAVKYAQTCLRHTDADLARLTEEGIRALSTQVADHGATGGAGDVDMGGVGCGDERAPDGPGESMRLPTTKTAPRGALRGVLAMAGGPEVEAKAGVAAAVVAGWPRALGRTRGMVGHGDGPRRRGRHARRTTGPGAAYAPSHGAWMLRVRAAVWTWGRESG